MVDPTFLRAMLNAGCSAEQLVKVAEDAARAKEEKRASQRAANAERQRRWRQAEKERNAMSRVTERDTCDTPSDKEKSPTPPKEITSPYSAPKGASYAPRDALAEVLDAEHAAAVLEHRQRLRKPLTAFAAQKLAAQLARWPNPNEAADAMLANGWQGFKPEWMETRSRPASTAPPKKLTQGESLRNMARAAGVIDDTGSPVRRLEEGKRDGENPGVGDVIRLAVAGNHGWGTG